MRSGKPVLKAAAAILLAGGISSMVISAVVGCQHSAAKSTAVASASRAEGLAAWEQVYSVLTHPRCINCHTATDSPQQGDGRQRHFANVVRGPEGKGVPGLNCAGCHQEANADSTSVPGGHDWHLAPLSMKWQDLNDKPLSSAAVCRAVT